MDVNLKAVEPKISDRSEKKAEGGIETETFHGILFNTRKSL